MPWWITLAIELIRLLPPLIRAIKEDPCPNNKESTKVVMDKVKDAIGSPPELKNI